MGASGYLKICCFQSFFYVHPDPLGCMIQLDEDIFQIGFLQQPTSYDDFPLQDARNQKNIAMHLPSLHQEEVPVPLILLFGSGTSSRIQGKLH